MRTVEVRSEGGDVVAERVLLAHRWWQRLRGMLGRAEPRDGEGMLLVPCRAVHMAGMRYPLDVAFLDREGRVVAVYEGLAPGGRSRYHREARAALELRAGTLARAGIAAGQRLTWEGRT